MNSNVAPTQALLAAINRAEASFPSAHLARLLDRSRAVAGAAPTRATADEADSIADELGQFDLIDGVHPVISLLRALSAGLRALTRAQEEREAQQHQEQLRREQKEQARSRGGRGR